MKLKRYITSGFSNGRHLLLLAVMTIFAIPFFTNCGGRQHDPRLVRISEFVSEKPEDALDSLQLIDENDLNERNRTFRDLLTIKARDKAYIVHTSDSLILSVIDYYTDHHDDTLTPEALYYGGRVYSDIGDYLTALNYFQQALDLLPENTSNIILRGNVLSQTGGVLENLGMFKQSIPYIKDVIEINRHTHDTLNLAYNNRMLGSVFMEMQEYDSAEYYFRKSLTHLNSLPPEFGIETQVFQAANKYERGDIDSALLLIHPTINQINKEFKSYTLGYASKVYLKANLLDSAYMLSHLLATDTNLDNRKSGYKIMLSSELRKYIPKDSLDYFQSDYKNVMEDFFYNRESEETLIQNSLYNYQVHDRNRQKAEIKSKNLAISLLVTICIALIIIMAILILHIKKRNKIIELQSTINNLNKIIKSFGENVSAGQQEKCLTSECDKYSEPIGLATNEDIITEQSLNDDIRVILTQIKESAQPKRNIPDSIISSEAYTIIRKHIAEKNIIPSSEEHIWEELEKLVLEESPQFLTRLKLLLGRFPDIQNLRIALLIKCGLNSSQTGLLLGRSKSTISYRRANLCAKILGNKADANYLDDVIRAL